MNDNVSKVHDQIKINPETMKWLMGLLILAVLIRLGLWFAYEPIAYGDTGSYLRLGEWVLGIGERGFDGTRVPGYPVFTALFGLRPERIWLGQMVLGGLTSWMLFILAWGVTQRAWLGFLLGGLYNLIPGQLLFEANLLTETLTIFLVVLSLFLFQRLSWSTKRVSAMLLAAALGISASLVGMVRPLFFPLTLIILPFLWWGLRGKVQDRIRIVATYALFPLLIQGGWLFYMRTSWSVLSPTTMAGYSMVQHTGGYFEYLPDEYAAIRDTYIGFRDAQVAERGVQTNAIWEAIPEMSKASGLGFYELSRELNRLSWMLVRQHPELYLRNVVLGWINFWKAPVYWQPELMQPQLIREFVQALTWFGRGLSVLANFGFLLLSLGLVLSRELRYAALRDRGVGLAIGIVWIISIIQTILDHGDNPRFLVPLQMLVFLVVVYLFDAIFEQRRKKVGS